MFVQNADDNIVRYLAGKVPNNNLNNIPQWQNKTTTNSNIEATLHNNFSNGYGITGILQGKDINNNYKDNIFAIYGKYFTADFTAKGYVGICNNSGELIKLLTKFDSNVEMYNITAMNVEDNGKITAVEKIVNTQNPNGKMRYLLLNNFLVPDENNEYKIHIRESRIFPTDVLTAKDYFIYQFNKNPNQDEVMFCTVYNKTTNPGTGSYTNGVVLIKLVNQIGSSPEWTYQYFTKTKINFINDFYYNWSNKEGQILCVYDYSNTLLLNVTENNITSKDLGGVWYNAKIRGYNDIFLDCIDPPPYNYRIKHYNGTSFSQVYQLNVNLLISSSKLVKKERTNIFLYCIRWNTSRP